MTSILLITAASLSLFLAGRGLWQRDKMKALTRVKCLATRPVQKIPAADRRTKP
jgi:hypothetical protein